MELTEFLLARIAEDEAVARDSFYEGQHWFSEEESVQSYLGPGDDESVWMADRKRDARHVVRWQPARVLAECEAKRRARNMQSADELDRILALPYADHPDYQPDWRP